MKIHATRFHRFPWRKKLRTRCGRLLPRRYVEGRIPAYCRDLKFPCLDKGLCPKEISCDD